jgi:hypothetical protein
VRNVARISAVLTTTRFIPLISFAGSIDPAKGVSVFSSAKALSSLELAVGSESSRLAIGVNSALAAAESVKCRLSVRMLVLHWTTRNWRV